MYPMPHGRTAPWLSTLFRDRSPRDLREDTRFAVRLLGIMAMPILFHLNLGCSGFRVHHPAVT